MSCDDSLTQILQEWVEVFMHRSMGSMIFYLKENNLSMSQIGALFQIKCGDSNVSDLGEGLAISKAAASQMLDHLVAQELILRSEDPQDRRFKKIVLTDKGRRVIQDSVRIRKGLLENLVSKMSESEKEQILNAIKILIDKTSQLDVGPISLK